MPKVSVVIPTYNRAELVGIAIQSVLDQTYTDWELIVVDDGSQDNTRDVVAGYTDPRIRYIYQNNKKLPGARNTGIKVSSGEYVAFLDSDDAFLQNRLQRQVAALDRDPDLGLVASGWTEINQEGEPRRTVQPWQLKPGLTLTDLLYHCPFPPSATMVRRQWLLQVELFDPEQHYVEDWDLWLRLASAGCRMAWVPSTEWLQRIHYSKSQTGEGNMSRNAERMIAGLFRLLDKFFTQPNLSEVVRRQRNKVYANANLDSAMRAFSARKNIEGENYLREAVHLNPTLLSGDPPAILQSLASNALTPLVSNMDQYIKEVCPILPKVSPQLARSPRQLLALIWATAAFDELANGHRQQARFKAVQTFLTDPTWLRNRGLLSILLKL